MVVNKPLSKLEMKILIFNKVKNGMSYSDATKQLKGEIGSMIENSKKKKEVDKRTVNEKFKDEFKKLTNGKSKRRKMEL